MSFGPSNPSSFAAMFAISSSLSMHKPETVGESGHPCHVAQKVLQETTIHFQLALNLLINRATISL